MGGRGCPLVTTSLENGTRNCKLYGKNTSEPHESTMFIGDRKASQLAEKQSNVQINFHFFLGSTKITHTVLFEEQKYENFKQMRTKTKKKTIYIKIRIKNQEIQ